MATVAAMEVSPAAVCRLNAAAAIGFGLMCVLAPPLSVTLYFDDSHDPAQLSPTLRCAVTLLG